jgi:hypothetical protein
MDVEPLYHGVLYNETSYDVEVLIVEVVEGVGTVIDMFIIPPMSNKEIDLPAGHYAVAAKCPIGVLVNEYQIPGQLRDPTKPFHIHFRDRKGRGA